MQHDVSVGVGGGRGAEVWNGFRRIHAHPSFTASRVDVSFSTEYANNRQHHVVPRGMTSLLLINYCVNRPTLKVLLSYSFRVESSTISTSQKHCVHFRTFITSQQSNLRLWKANACRCTMCAALRVQVSSDVTLSTTSLHHMLWLFQV